MYGIPRTGVGARVVERPFRIPWGTLLYTGFELVESWCRRRSAVIFAASMEVCEMS